MRFGAGPASHPASIDKPDGAGLARRELRPYESRVGSAESGLAKPSRLVANQIRTVSRQRIGEVLGRVNSMEEQEIDRALRIQLAL